MCGPLPIHVQRKSFWKRPAGAILLSVPPPVLSGYVYAIRPRNSYPGGITSLSWLQGWRRPWPWPPRAGGELGAAPGRHLGSMTEGSGYKGLPQNTCIPYLRQKQTDPCPLERPFLKNVIVKPCLGRQILFSPQNYIFFFPLSQCQPSVPSLSPGTLLISLPSAEALGTPNCSTAAKKTKHFSLANSLRS